MTTPILVTGGTGTLGRPVAQRLRETGERSWLVREQVRLVGQLGAETGRDSSCRAR